MPQQQAQAQAAGQELIRLDKRPDEGIFIIKLYNGTGWRFWHKFSNEGEAQAKYRELLDGGKHIEG